MAKVAILCQYPRPDFLKYMLFPLWPPGTTVGPGFLGGCTRPPLRALAGGLDILGWTYVRAARGIVWLYHRLACLAVLGCDCVSVKVNVSDMDGLDVAASQTICDCQKHPRREHQRSQRQEQRDVDQNDLLSRAACSLLGWSTRAQIVSATGCTHGAR
jgi:hypothetical protein